MGQGRTLGGEGSNAERQRPRGCVLAAIILAGFVVVCGFLGLLFVLHGAPNGWLSGLDTGRLASGRSRFGDNTATPEADT